MAPHPGALLADTAPGWGARATATVAPQSRALSFEGDPLWGDSIYHMKYTVNYTDIYIYVYIYILCLF